MPALMSSNDLIGSSLKKSFGKKKNHDHLEEHITLSSNLILNHKVEYVAAISNQHNVLSKHLKAKYMVLGKTASVANSSVNNMTREEASSSAPEGCLPPPKIILHKWTDVELGWKRNVPVGAGMINLGNTCYLNSTLQALFHVPSFTNWILNEKKHKARCNQKTPDGAPQCTLCAVEMTLRTTHDKTGSAIKPSYVYRRLNAICKHLIHGRQEDAHEFMRYLMEAMDKSYLMSMNAMKLDARSKETSPINQIFGGYLRQEVKCLKCHYVSVTHQHFQDLSLDIARVSSLDEAFALFFRKETLDGSNVYKCDRCKQKVPATKQCFLERPPHVLCVQLKRFSGFGGKLNKPVQYSQNVNLTRFLHESQRSKLPITYKFTSLVNHLGSSQNCGHYTAVAMASNGNCYMFDDCSVRSVSINATQTSSAYILLFERSQPPAEISANYQLTSAAPAKLATPSGKPTPKLVMLPRPVPAVKPTIIGIDGMVKPSAATPLKNGNLPASKEREKITFNLNSKQETPEQNKPRLVINQKFKNGVASSVLTNGAKPVLVKKSEPVAAKAAVSDVKKENGPKSLVPYESDSDEDRKDSGKMDRAEVRATENKWKVTPATSETSSVAGSSTSDWLILEADGNTRWENVKRKLANFTGKIFKRAKSEERTSISEPSRSSKFSSDTESLSSPIPKKVKKEKLKTCEEVEETSRKQNEKNAEIEGLKKFQKEHNDKVKLSEKVVTVKAKESTPTSLKYDVCPKKDRSKIVSVKEEDKKPEEKPAELPVKVVGSAASSDDVVSQLKDMSHLGFGNQVSSWNGTKSKVDIEGETLRNQSRKRTAEDLYNEELDMGKERKFKTRKQEYRSSDGNQNAFQSFQDYKRQKHENGYSANNSFSDWNSNRSQSKWTPNRSWSDNGRYNTGGGGFQRRKSWNNGGDRNGGYRSDRYNWNSNSKYRR